MVSMIEFQKELGKKPSTIWHYTVEQFHVLNWIDAGTGESLCVELKTRHRARDFPASSSILLFAHCLHLGKSFAILWPAGYSIPFQRLCCYFLNHWECFCSWMIFCKFYQGDARAAAAQSMNFYLKLKMPSLLLQCSEENRNKDEQKKRNLSIWLTPGLPD